MQNFHDDAGWQQGQYEAQQAERETRIQELQDEKAELLDKYGLFGGGPAVNEKFRRINHELEALGIDPTR